MKKLFNDPYIDWNHKWRDFKFSLENRFSEADLIYAFYSGFIVFVILVAMCFFINTISEESLRREKLIENIESCLELDYTANINGVELNSLDKDFIESAPVEYNVAIDNESKVILFTSKGEKSRNRVSLIPIMFR